MLLVLILAQMSILFELYKNIDSSFTDQFAGVIKTLCRVTEDMANLEVALLFASNNDTEEVGIFNFSGLGEDASGSAATDLLRGTGLLDQLCFCTELDVPRRCIAQWISDQWRWALVAVTSLLGFESFCAVLAWTYVDEIEEDTVARIKKKQKKAAPTSVPGWSLAAGSVRAGVGIGEDLQEKARHEAVLLTSTWYFEGTVLFACIVMFVVLALQSKTVPPSGDLAVVLSMGEVFVTLFLTVDVSIQVVICMTRAERANILKGKSPWVTMDILALLASWAHLAADTQWRIFSLGRVLRVLRPMRTLRMLSDINTVLQTIVAALPLFGQACLLITFMLVAYSLICMSLWSGALNYECERPMDWTAPAEQNMSNSILHDSAAPDVPESARDVSISVESLNSFLASPSPDAGSTYECPACLECPEEGSGLFAVSWCSPVQPPRFVRSEAYGFTGFDSFPQAMLTMFVQMTGDGGMHDVPFALENAGATLGTFGWTLMMTAVLVLTLLALNLFLAVCCSVFDDVHEQVTSKNKRIIERDEGYGTAFAEVNGGKASGGMLSLMNTISAAAQQTLNSNHEASANAKEVLKSTEQKYIDYLDEVAAIDWRKRSRIGGCRSCSRTWVLSHPFRISVNVMVMMNALVLMSNHHGMVPEWRALNLALETLCLLFFWFELSMKVLGYGRTLYFRSNTHRLDVFVLVCCSAGWAGNVLSLAAELLPIFFPGYELFSRGLHAFSSIRLVRLMRALQMSRWIYSHREMRELIETVFKSWQSVLLIGIFTVFSLTMFGVISMHLLGGSLGPTATIEDYPRRNVETFFHAFSVSFQYLTGESWSEVMYWYMKHADMHRYGVALYMVVQFVWMRCLLFSLFVAVLLVNFSVDEDDKMPRQRIKFDREEAEALKAGHKAGSAILRALNMGSMEGMGEKKLAPTPLEVLDAYNIAEPDTRQEGEKKDYTRRSCMMFDTTHPFRLLCAKIESHPLFDSVVMYMILFSCVVLAFESPDMKADFGVYFDIFNLALLCLFYMEMLVKMVVHGAFRSSGPTLPYYKNPLNRLDFFVLFVITCTYVLPLGGIGDAGAAGRVLRLVRVMMPMLELMRNDSLRALINTFALSLPAVGAIMCLLSILLAVFGIVGVEYFGGRLYRCVYADDLYNVVPLEEVHNRTQCEARDDALWRNPAWDFDNIFSAGVTLFYICINSSWLEIMESTLDITEIDEAPVQNSSPHFWLYFCAFHVTFSFFMLNLFIGVLSSAFSAQSGSNLITALQRRWIRVLAMLKSFTPEDSAIERPEVGVKLWKLRGRCWDCAENQSVENLWTAGILLNVLLLILDHYPASAEWEWFLVTMNFGCLLLFTAEIIIKLLAYSPLGFLSDGWHQMDLVVVVGSWMSKIFGVKAGIGVVRAFRTVRLVLLVKRMPGLMSLMNTVIACIGPAANIAAISGLVFYLYAVIGMKLFGGASTDMQFYNDQNNFETFFSTMRLLFQLINGQDMKSMINDLRTLEFGWVIPFFFLATFFFLVVFICMNLFIVTVLDNFANLCSMDDVRMDTDDLDAFAAIWHRLTYEKIWEVDAKEVGIDISDEMLNNMEDAEIEQLFEQKYERESDLRLRNWADFRRSFPLAPYMAEHDPVFAGWLHRPNALASVTGGLLKVNDLRYFWVDGSVKEPQADGHLCLNWFSDGATERELDSRHTKGNLVINRVQIKVLKTSLPPVKMSRQKTAFDVSNEIGALHRDGRINKMAAALSGRAWLVALANAQANHPQNAMAAAFSLSYYENVLGDPNASENEDPVASPRVHEIMQEDEALTPLQSRFRLCIGSGVTIPSTTAGMYACTAGDYATFWPVFSRVIAQVHGLGSQYVEPDLDCWPVPPDADDADGGADIDEPERDEPTAEAEAEPRETLAEKSSTQQHGIDLVGAHSFGSHGWDITTIDREKLPEIRPDFDLDLGLLAPVSMPSMPIRLSAARNLQAFNLIATMKRDERTTVEDLLGHTIMMLLERPEWRGRYVSLTPGHLNEIQASEHEELAAEGLMFPSALNFAEMEASGLTTDWPYGRGCWISQDERTTVWIGYEDHIIVNAGGNSETDVDVLLDQLKVMLDIVEDTDGIEFRFDPERCGFITSSVQRVGTGMVASAKVKLPKLTIDGSADRIREIIEEKQLDMQIVAKEKEIAQGFKQFSSMTSSLMSSDDVESGGEVHLEVKRTYAVTEAHIAASLYVGLKAIWEAEQQEKVLFGSFADTTIGKYIAQACGQAQRQKKVAMKLADKAEERAMALAEEAARLAEEQAMKAQEMAMAAAREAQAAAIAAAKMAEEQAMAAAREAEKATMAGIEAGKKAAQEAQAMAVAGIEAAEGRLDGGKTSPGGEASRLGVLSLSLSLLLVCTPAIMLFTVPSRRVVWSLRCAYLLSLLRSARPGARLGWQARWGYPAEHGSGRSRRFRRNVRWSRRARDHPRVSEDD
jgi:hypothetical protein